MGLSSKIQRADELLTYSWCNMFGLTATGVRFFTVYRPWGRPHMSPMIFGRCILEDKPIPLFNKGDLWRDFTYVDDIVEGLVRLMNHLPQGDVAHELYNIGNHNPVQMLEFVKIMEDVLGKKAQLDLQDWPKSEVYKTYADTQKLRAAVGWAPSTDLRVGLQRFADWLIPYWEAEQAKKAA
jgi:UDP-glucuronate 4-epimerase